MSVEKPSHIERPHRQAERTSGSGNAPQPKKLVFDPVQTAIERQITQEKPVDAFTAAMREAQDGDSEEAIARRLALGGEQKDLIDDQIETKRQKRPRSVHRADEEPEADNSKQDTQKTKNVQRSGAVERYVTPETTTNSAKRVSREQSHQHLMMFSVSMDRNQTATHVAQIGSVEGVREMAGVGAGVIPETSIGRNVA